MTSHPATALITGGTGFLGAHVVRAWLAELDFADQQVVVLDDLSGSRRDNLPSDARVTFVEGSIADDQLVEDLFARYRFRYVYHLAAYAAEGLSHFIRRFNYTNNLIGSVTLLNASLRHKAECFVFSSSIAVYGSAPPPMTEETVPQPEDPYGIAKYAVELDLRAAHEMFGINYVIFRPHNVYGEYQNIGDRYRNVVGIFMNRLLQGKPMPIFGDGTQQRAFTYVGDIAPIIARSPRVDRAQNQIFNVGADRPYRVLDLAHAVAQAMGLPAKIEHLPARQEVHLAYASHSRSREVFGDLPQTTLETGLAKTAEWVRQVGVRSTPEFTQIEVREKLPPSWQEWK